MIRTLAATLATTTCVVALATPAAAQTREYNIPAGSLKSALDAYVRQSGRQVVYRADQVRSARSPGTRGQQSAEAALAAILAGSGFTTRVDGNLVAIVRAEGNAPAAAESAVSSVEDASGNADIVVTGTNIRGVVPAASPLLQFDRRAIERSAYESTQDFIQRGLPQNFGAGGAEDLVAAGLRGGAQLNQGQGSAVNLRGLGTTSTLVLLNGRRMAPSGFGSFVDISMIPLAAIDRIDVLTDGASATYGSDAIGGVVNFVLRDDFEGAESRLAYGGLSNSDTSSIQLGQTVGTAWDTGRALAVYDYSGRDALSSQDRANTRDALDRTDLLPRQRRHTALLSVSQNLTDTVELFADGLYSHRTALQKFVNPFGDEPRPETVERANAQINIVGGMRADLSKNWNLELSGTYSFNQIDNDYTYPATDDAPLTTHQSFKSWFLDGRLDGSIIALPGGDLKLAIGAQYRTELLKTSEDGLDALPSKKYQRNVLAGFAELHAPLVSERNSIPGIRKLDLNGAVRYERYSDFGHSIDPKVGLAWVPVDGLKLRSTWGTSFRAPRLEELDDSDITVFLVNFTDTSVPSGKSLGALLLGNSPELGPERATTWTVGADLEFNRPDIQVNFTYFNIDFKDRIGRPSASAIAFGDLASPVTSPFLISRDPQVVRPLIMAAIERVLAKGSFVRDLSGGLDPSTSTVLADARSQNLARTKVEGLDLRLVYQTESPVGQWNFEANGSYLLRYDEQASSTAPGVSVLDTVYRPTDFRARASVGWTAHGYQAGLSLNYVDGYRDNRLTQERNVPSWTTLDARVAIDIGSLLNSRRTANTQLSLSILNLTNKLPPVVPSLDDTEINFDPENHDINGRSILISLRHKW